MESIQGEFASQAAAQEAKSSLIKAGVPDACIRIWNIIPDATSRDSSQDSGAAGGLIIGGTLGGAAGLGAGAAIGAAWDENSSAGQPLPGTTGARVVVDINPGQAGRVHSDIVSLLQQAGAANIRPVPS